MEVHLNVYTVVETRFLYRVDGPVPDHVREALNIRYGPKGWFHVRRRPPPPDLSQFTLHFFDISIVTRPADPPGFLIRRDRGTPSR